MGRKITLKFLFGGGNMAKLLKRELFDKILSVDEKIFRAELKSALKDFGRRVQVKNFC